MKRQYIGITVVILACMCIATVPFLYLYWITGSFLPGVMPQLQSDILYYLVQIDEVLSGRWLLGNPYFMEYGHLRSPAILLPIWIAAIPGLFGLPINVLFLVNAYLYSVLTGILFYVLLYRCSKGNVMVATALSIIGTAYCYDFILRPAIMQVVYPVFLMFLITFLLYLEKPHNWPIKILLAFTTALSFYTYLYVWMIAFTMLGLILCWDAAHRRYKLIRNHSHVIILALILCGPQIYIMLADASNPMFQELTARTGLISSHLIRPLTLLNLKYIFATSIVLSLLYRKKDMPKSAILILLVSMGIIISACSNLITGIELDLPTHPWRLSLIITPIATACFLLTATKEKRGVWEKLLAIGMVMLLLGTLFTRIIISNNSFHYFRDPAERTETYKSIQQYKSALDFLNTMEPKRQVVLTVGLLGSYIPLYTDHTLLFHGTGRFNVIPTEELQERFLMNYVDHITEDFLTDIVNIRDLVGNGPLQKQQYENVCEALPFCKSDGIKTPLERVGGQEFIQKFMKRSQTVSHEYKELLKKFNVSLIAIDKENMYPPRMPDNAERIYSDQRVEIWQLKVE
ncbi:MAG: hypothetical protein PHU04_04860 [Candidatus Peribacteraceae bacterium]|nr:hypothetical protein [Candidatus Peribacteraceae bacterium]